MPLSEPNVLRLSRLVRPFMRRKTPLLYRLCRLLLGVLCPRKRPYRLVAEYDGGLIQVDSSTSIGFSLLFRGCHEPEVAALIAKLVRPGDTCLDVGAHIGSHTLLMARLAGPGGHVFALEPHPEMCERLLENIALNRYTNVQVLRAALSDKDGATEFFGFAPGARNRGISSLLPDTSASERMEVPTLSGETLQQRLKPSALDFVKIDVEGSERLVLEQLAELIALHRPCLIFEYQKSHWDKFGSTPGDTLERLRALDYAFYGVRDDVTRRLAGEVSEDCELLCIPAQRELPLR